MKKFRQLVPLFLAAALLVSAAFCGSVPAQAAEPTGSEVSEAAAEAPYSETLFDPDCVHRIEITIAPADWEDLQANPLNKTKYSVTVTIDGETLDNVRFSTKGSSSLRETAASSFYNSRYSYKLSFGALTEGQTYHGLDTLSLDNGFEDPSCVRDWLAYRLFARAGVPAPCVCFTELTVNGQLQGLYYAVENEGASFLRRNGMYPSTTYSPEPAVLTERNSNQGQDIAIKQTDARHQVSMPLTKADTAGTTGADLKYTGDDPALYSDIFDNAEIAITAEDEARVIAALKAVSVGRAADGLDTDEVIRYFAVHNFITSSDSYTGVMMHNYLLAERDGFLSMLPWDYNLAFTAVEPVHTDDEDYSDSVIHMDIDNPGFMDVTAADRPMFHWITQDEEALAQYHTVLSETLLPYFESGEFEADMAALREMIRPYLAADPTYCYTMEEFDENFAGLVTFCLSRADAVRGQLG